MGPGGPAGRGKGPGVDFGGTLVSVHGQHMEPSEGEGGRTGKEEHWEAPAGATRGMEGWGRSGECATPKNAHSLGWGAMGFWGDPAGEVSIIMIKV